MDTLFPSRYINYSCQALQHCCKLFVV